MADTTEKTYEMLWNCEYCGTARLLGKTHRHCPECGAVQNPEKRYFPPDEEKVAVEDHQYVGADRYCGACKAPNSAKAKHCTECGAPMDSASEVEAVQKTPSKAMAGDVAGEVPRKKKGKKKWIIVAAVVIAAAVVCVAIFWKKPITVTLTGHTWIRTIMIDRYTVVREEQWCDMVPAGAYDISRFRDVRGYNQIPEGEACTVKRVDNRDGTFSERRECKPKYRKEAIYDEKCRYAVNRWTEIRPVQARGNSLTPAPTWPQVNIPLNPPAVIGAERAGRRWENLNIVLAGPKGEKFLCEVPASKWLSMAEKSVWNGKISPVTNNFDCGSLKPMK